MWTLLKIFSGILTLMFPIPKDVVVTVRGVPYARHVILADVNVPYKFALDRTRNVLFFCMNADDFSDQSFHSVALNLETETASIVQGIRNGFACAVDQTSGRVYLGGSDGIFAYNYSTNDIDKPSIITSLDIFDMYYDKELYFVDTSTQTLRVFRKGKAQKIPEAEGHLIHHFILDGKGLFFVNPTGLYFLKTGSSAARLLDEGNIHYRGATVDAFGKPYFIAQDGIYAINEQNGHPENILTVENGFGLAFDKKNNIIYSDDRSVIKLIHY